MYCTTLHWMYDLPGEDDHLRIIILSHLSDLTWRLMSSFSLVWWKSVMWKWKLHFVFFTISSKMSSNRTVNSIYCMYAMYPQLEALNFTRVENNYFSSLFLSLLKTASSVLWKALCYEVHGIKCTIKSVLLFFLSYLLNNKAVAPYNRLVFIFAGISAGCAWEGYKITFQQHNFLFSLQKEDSMHKIVF